MTRIRQVAPLLHIINFNNLCFRVENETTLISAKNGVDLSSISEVRSYITEWPRFFWATLQTPSQWRIEASAKGKAEYSFSSALPSPSIPPSLHHFPLAFLYHFSFPFYFP